MCTWIKAVHQQAVLQRMFNFSQWKIRRLLAGVDLHLIMLELLLKLLKASLLIMIEFTVFTWVFWITITHKLFFYSFCNAWVNITHLIECWKRVSRQESKINLVMCFHLLIIGKWRFHPIYLKCYNIVLCQCWRLHDPQFLPVQL